MTTITISYFFMYSTNYIRLLKILDQNPQFLESRRRLTISYRSGSWDIFRSGKNVIFTFSRIFLKKREKGFYE